MRHDGSEWVQALADTAAHAVVAGIVSEVVDADNFVLTYVGQVTGLSGLTGGSLHYLQDDGSLDTTAGTVTVPVLVATSATAGVLVPMAAGGAGGAAWGDLTGTLSDQTDLQSALDDKANTADLGTAAAADTGDFATAAQGSLADSAVQPGDPISVNAQTGTTYTLVLTDAGKLVTLANAPASR